MLQKLVLQLAEAKPVHWHAILSAVPACLVDLEICAVSYRRQAVDTFNNSLFEPLTFKPGRDVPALLPNLHTLSLLGTQVHIVDVAAFTAMIRSRAHENDSTEHGAILQSLRIHIGERLESTTAQEFEEVKAIMGDRADIRMIPITSPGDYHVASFGMIF